MFVVTVFSPEHLRIYAGRGKGSDIEVSNQFTLAEVDELVAAMDQRFQCGAGVLQVLRRVGEEWLMSGRGDR